MVTLSKMPCHMTIRQNLLTPNKPYVLAIVENSAHNRKRTNYFISRRSSQKTTRSNAFDLTSIPKPPTWNQPHVVLLANTIRFWIVWQTRSVHCRPRWRQVLVISDIDRLNTQLNAVLPRRVRGSENGDAAATDLGKDRKPQRLKDLKLIQFCEHPRDTSISAAKVNNYSLALMWLRMWTKSFDSMKARHYSSLHLVKVGLRFKHHNRQEWTNQQFSPISCR